MIYQADLSDPSHFLHIIRNYPELPVRLAAHYWCDDMDSPYPTWQHGCYGESRPGGPWTMFYPRTVTVTEDRMLALLLSCRRMQVPRDQIKNAVNLEKLCRSTAHIVPRQYISLSRLPMPSRLPSNNIGSSMAFNPAYPCFETVRF
ncbi:hypothetical protein M011DRAFT_114312 [Sporormia fimetaria CBS 119925]|uniref:Uncharacterized protein n=1 Tax=Sporormia fimetaria CBS 119925 TaxID=1340428 RepID=A0A6A6VNW9_9PLEO|nr:hypothetical protein M011DRAFT_114312 [Sporormia fimetaria CBS 119925]